MINMTPAEKAYFDSKGAVDPTTGEAAPETPAPEAEAPVAETPAAPEQQAEPESPQPEEEEGEPETVDVANAEGEPRRKMIAYGAYAKEKAKRNRLIEEKSELAQKLAYMEGLLSQVQQGRQAQTPQGATPDPKAALTPPDYKTQGEQWIEWVTSQVKNAAQATQQHQELTQQQRAMAETQTAVAAAERDFASKQPDFYDALKYAQDARSTELTALGYQPVEIQRIMQAEVQGFVNRAMQQGANPAERIYAYSKAKGYKKPAPAKAEPSEAEKIARQAANQAAAKTIASMAGGAEKPLTIETLANMSPKEFQKLYTEGKVHDTLGLPKPF